MKKLGRDEVEKYYKLAPETSTAQLVKLREVIKSALKNCDETISYQLPHFRIDGKKVLAIGGFKDHVSIFPMGKKYISEHAKELKSYKTSPGTIQFPLDAELPKNLIKKIVAARLKDLNS